MKKPVALIILDGFGIREKTLGNAIKSANLPNFNKFINNYPHTQIEASGMAVGLPEGQMGNSEVGHLNIGAGRIVYQELTRISKEIREGEFFKNQSFLDAISHAKVNNKKLHLMGLVSDGGVHSHTEHLYALLEMAKQQGLEKVYVHCFLDGRDTPPQSAKGYIEGLVEKIKEIGVGRVATLSGRYYAMDRDKRWERTKLAYDALVDGKGRLAENPVAAVEMAYSLEETDEFVLPTVIPNTEGLIDTVEEDDSVIFFNFRPDRARQMTRALMDKNFDGFVRDKDFFELHYVTMTLYDKSIENVDIAYKPQSFVNTLGEYVSAKGLKQLRIAETEKYAHVTYFFNGGVETPNPGEDRKLIQSPQVATYDLKPEMSAEEVTEELLKELDKDQYDLIVLNYANPDMVGHTGIVEAVIKALEKVDDCLGRVVGKILEKGGKAIVTSDHGNSEELIDEVNGTPVTAHTINPVPLILIGHGGVKLREDGKLCDIAPTLLELMELEQPAEMTGNTLILK
ncbi:2,3-bisphosphoglycerate-independent phosphoglycerate mutase [Clostridium formicaceticum]|uniref:2,3-bisphosphoglycerate-independent phosphoglycerate mutase n=1 Tax=Clostridium formicaceticum TaxID=1497 RepID=A0AAC9RPA5_9CLOT|nr:2,3-bisphosphoglycerate-independent phosphoglycerate mutase [Clostridium formicaceticum]AOY77890.1 phosphoglycerate mutase (2,3-diphosphoglycerate-independent) [Clostridium formicaceticum]ARE88508.1 2,3-bisphosphoglycerate-independent phosphoglycerate mutase [Clostridium formicaceticum]